MRAVRTGTLIGVALVGAGLAVNTINCASATTITLDVRAASEICEKITQTGIAVTPATKVDKADIYALQEYQDGCRDGKIGTLVITPHSSETSDRQARVGIRVVAGLNGRGALDCDDPGGKVGESCIIQKREVSFVKGNDVPLTIVLNGNCVHVTCPDGFTCDPDQTDPAKKCVDRTVPPGSSSGENPDAYVPAIDSGPPKEDAEAGTPPTPAELCERGKNGRTYNPATNQCVVSCTVSKDCSDTDPCPPGQKCKLLCNGDGACSKARCSGPDCDFDCTGADDAGTHCKDISCDAGACKVTCKSTINSCVGVTMTGAANSMECTKVDGQPSCNDVKCIPGGANTCERTCDGPAPNACGTQAQCNGNCTKFEDGGT